LLPTAAAAQGFSLIRDAEIEKYLRQWVTPILEAAQLENEAVSIYLVNDKTPNAFVVGGQNIFVHTGTLTIAKSPGEVIGVVAHEVGHIVGGHLSRSGEAGAAASKVSLLSMLAGVAAIVAGAPDAGATLIAGSGGFAQRAFFAHTRVQESAADQSALRFLTETHQSARGLIRFFEYLQGYTNQFAVHIDPYTQSHPLTRTRITRLLEAARATPYWDTPENPVFVEQFRRMQAKLHGFLSQPQEVFYLYPEKDTSIYARYARAVAHHRLAERDKALAEVNSLLAKEPANPYFNELKGQIEFEGGHPQEAIGPYRAAIKYARDEALFRVGLAQAIIATEDKSLTDEAIMQLRVANQRDPYNSMAWYQLAIAYAQEGNTTLADLATAERYMLIGRFREAAGLANRASTRLADNSPDWWRAQDIVNQAVREYQKQLKQQRGRRRR